MAYSNTAAVLRADINGKVEEGAIADSAFIGDKVMPVFSSPTRTGQYPVFKLGISDLLKDDATTRARGGAYNRVTRDYISDNFTTLDRGLEESIDDAFDERDLSRFFNMEVATAMRVLQQVKIGYERRVAAAIQNTTTFTATNASVAYTSANLATIDVPGDVYNLLDRLSGVGIKANTMAMSAPVFNLMRRSTLLQNLVRGKRSSDSLIALSEAEIAQAFDLDQVLVGRAPYATNSKGATFASSFCWSNATYWVGQVSGGELLESGAGRTIVWNQEGGLFVTETYREEQKRSDVVRVRQNTAEKILNAVAGQIVNTSYS